MPKSTVSHTVVVIYVVGCVLMALGRSPSPLLTNTCRLKLSPAGSFQFTHPAYLDTRTSAIIRAIRPQRVEIKDILFTSYHQCEDMK